jgi:hypothetical protein
MRYEFAGKDLETPAGIVVDNFMVLPDGSYGRDMDAVTRVAQNTGLRHFGAGQVQVLTSGAMSDQRRDEVFKEILQPIVPLLESMVSDGSQR